MGAVSDTRAEQQQKGKLMSQKKSLFGVRQMTLGAMLTAIVVLLQILANLIQPFPGVSITLVLVPIVVGAALLGPVWGGWLGLVFGAVVLISGGAANFLPIHALGTVLTVLVKGVCAGLAAGCVYGLLKKRNQYLAIICAAVVCPVVNTCIFFLGCRLFFWETIVKWGEGAGFENTAAFLILGLAGVNFLLELGINVVLAPVILRLVRLGK